MNRGLTVFAFTCLVMAKKKIWQYLPHAQQQNVKNAMQLVCSCGQDLKIGCLVIQKYV